MVCTYYAEINEENVCFYVGSVFSNEDDSPVLAPTGNIIRLDEKNLDVLGKKYVDGEWVEHKPLLQFEEQQQAKLQEINAICQSAIYTGIDVETSEGVKHFSLTQEDQNNIATMTAQVEKLLAGQPTQINLSQGVPYHADGEKCKHWSVEDFVKIATEAMGYIFYHQTYCNHLRAYIKRIEGYNELEAVIYGMELPEDLQASMNGLLGGGSIA